MIDNGVRPAPLVHRSGKSNLSFGVAERSESLTEHVSGDRLLEIRLQHQLRMSHYPDLRELNCRVINGVAKLSGFVATYYAKQMAQTIMLQTGLAERVDNMCQVGCLSNAASTQEAE